MYKKIELNTYCRGNAKVNNSSTNIQNSVKYFNKKKNYNILDKSININNRQDKLIFKNSTITNKNKNNSKTNNNIKDHNYSFNQNKNDIIYSNNIQTKNNMINKNQNYKSQQNINNVNNFLTKNQKINGLNTRFINTKKYLNSMINYDYKYKNNNTNLNCSNKVIFLNNKKNNNKSKIKNNICKEKSSILNNNKRIGNNKLFLKNSNNSHLTKIDNNNSNNIDATIYFNIPSKSYGNQNKFYIDKYRDYYQNVKKENYNDKRNPISIKKKIIQTNNNDINKYQFIGSENNYINNNYINIHSYINEEQINNIKKRKLELLKLLDFSSNIGTNNTKYNS